MNNTLTTAQVEFLSMLDDKPKPGKELPPAERRGVQRAIEWHKKNGRICREIANDDPHFNEDDRRRARQAGAQHDASAAGLQKVLIDEQSATIRELMETFDVT